jgi:hypothetical protein
MIAIEPPGYFIQEARIVLGFTGDGVSVNLPVFFNFISLLISPLYRGVVLGVPLKEIEIEIRLFPQLELFHVLDFFLTAT